MSRTIAISRRGWAAQSQSTGTQSTGRKNIIKKAVEKVKEPINDYEKSLELIDKHNLPVIYGALGADVTHGAASHHDKNIKIKDAYTPGTMIKRGLQRAAIGATTGAAYELTKNKLDDGEDIAKHVGEATVIGALSGATLGPALMYGTGKLAEHLRLKKLNKKDSNAKR